MVTPNTLGTAIRCTLTDRSQKGGHYNVQFESKDNNGAITLPYEFTPTPLVFNDGIRAENVTNCGNGSISAPQNGVMVYIE